MPYLWALASNQTKGKEMTRQERRAIERQIMKDIGKATRGTLDAQSGQTLRARITEHFPQAMKTKSRFQSIKDFLRTFGRKQIGFRKNA